MAGPLKNPRHEAFARELAKGKSADEAYEIAGYRANRGNACVLKAKQSVSDRVTELLGKAAQKLVVTVESLLDRSEEIRQAAFRDGQYAAAMAAVKEMGILAGVRVEKRDTTHRHVDQLTDAELCAILTETSGFDTATKASNTEKLN